MRRLKEANEKKLSKGVKSSKGLKNKKNENKRTREESESDDSDENVLQTVEEENREENYEDWVEEVIQEHYQEVDYQQPQWSDVKPGIFVLVDFLGGPRNTTHYKYVCCVKRVDHDDDGDIVVTGLKRENDLASEFSMNDRDVSTITFEMILAKLPEPEIKVEKRKMLYVFPGTVSVFEK